MLASLLPLDFRRKRLLKKVPDGALKNFYQMEFPKPGSHCHALNYLVLDFETTGLDPAKDEILSAGYVEIEGLEIKLNSATHQLVKPEQNISEASIIIHNITHDQAEQGQSLQAVLDELLERMSGKILIAHHASVEMGFLKQACQKVYRSDWLTPVIDTQWMAMNYRQKRNIHYSPGSMRLAALREYYHLPRYKAHNALSDALATAELFLALLTERESGGRLPLRSVLC
jgi:DNA polymerase-3 subunit epsilon